MNLMRKDFLR